MLRMIRIAAVALCASLLALGAGARDREVTIGLQAAITSIDPHYHNLSPNNSLLQHIFEPLIRRDANMKLVPGGAPAGEARADHTREIKKSQKQR